MNYDFNKLIGEAFKNVYEFDFINQTEIICLHKCFFVRAAKKANAKGYTNSEFFINCFVTIRSLINSYAGNILGLMIEKAKKRGNAKQKNENKKEKERMEKYWNYLQNVIDNDIYDFNYDKDINEYPLKLPVLLCSAISNNDKWFYIDGYDEDISYNQIILLILGLQDAQKELMPAKPQQTPGEQTAEPQQTETNQAPGKPQHYKCKINKQPITTEQQQYMFNELIKNGYIAPNTDFNCFCFAISGAPIEADFVQIHWQADLKDLYYFIGEFFYNEKSNKQKAFYCFLVDNKPINIKSLTNSYQGKEPPSADYFKELKEQLEKIK